jgi:hypothetical protein
VCVLSDEENAVPTGIDAVDERTQLAGWLARLPVELVGLRFCLRRCPLSFVEDLFLPKE